MIILVGVFGLLPGGSSVRYAVASISNANSLGGSIFSTAIAIAGGLALSAIVKTRITWHKTCQCCRKVKEDKEPADAKKLDDYLTMDNSALRNSSTAKLSRLMKKYTKVFVR